MNDGMQLMVCVGLLLASALVAGCAQPPTQQLEEAQKVVEAARTAGAPDYAKEDFAKLQQELALAKDELAKQEKTLSIFRSYTDADKILTRVAEEGKQVEARAVSNKEAYKTAALATEKEAKQVVASVEELIAKAPVGKDRAAVESIKQDMGALQSGLGPIHQLIEKGDYREAEVQAKALKDKASAVSAEIQKAIEKAKGRKMRTRVS